METTLANHYRPKLFGDVVGQASELEVVKKIVKNKSWTPPAVVLTGPFGTGKTTLSRLMARSLLCDSTQTNGRIDPCGECEYCLAMDRDNSLNYLEIDSASNGHVDDTRSMIEQMNYKIPSNRKRLICYDEAHMLSQPAQNSLLQKLEAGIPNVMFIFCTTNVDKILPTIRSRCVELRMHLLTAAQIAARLLEVARRESLTIDERSANLIATYSRGHVRDSLILLEQLARTADNNITEDHVRTFLRLETVDEVYKFLTEKDQATAFTLLENLLCVYGANELCSLMGDILLDAYKFSIGIRGSTQVDDAWLQKIVVHRGDSLLKEAESVLSIRPNFGSISHALASLGNALIQTTQQPAATTRNHNPSPLNSPQQNGAFNPGLMTKQRNQQAGV